MSVTIYIIKEQSAYQFGWDPVVSLTEPPFISRTWIRKLTVELPKGFSVEMNKYDEPMVFRGNEAYKLATNKQEDPVILDHNSYGSYIPLVVLHEGWDCV